MLGPEPFAVREGRLVLEELDLAEIAGELAGRAAWVVSQTALDAVVDELPHPSTLAVGALGPVTILERLAAQGWWARCLSVHELHLALAAGFPASRLVASGAVQDDGFIMEALTCGVAVVAVASGSQRENVARIAGFLDRPVPAELGAPPEAAGLVESTFGGLLAPLLGSPPALAIDAPWPPRGPVATGFDVARGVWPLRPGGGLDVTLVGLSGLGVTVPEPATLHGPVSRGDWVVVPTPWATRLRWNDRVHPEPPTVLVRGGFWRLLESRPDPPVAE